MCGEREGDMGEPGGGSGARPCERGRADMVWESSRVFTLLENKRGKDISKERVPVRTVWTCCF